ncbi:MAG: phage tail spike protein [Dysgonamonadaceae bacterium]
MKVIDPKLTLEDSAAGSLSMTLPPSNIGYGTIVRMVSDISVHKDGEEIWAGRVLSEDKDFWNNRVLYCEGELAFLNDSTQPPAEYYGQTVRGFLETLINIHNSKVADDKQFTIGSVTVTDSDDPLYRYTNYEKTIECINEKLVKKLGGHLRIRKVDGVRYLDYLADYPNTNSQIIEFGKNLLDFTRKWDLTEFATVIIPLGNRLDESPIEALDAYLTVESVNNGSFYVQSSEAVASYGWIEKVIHWDDVSTASSLLSKAEAYLSDIQFDNMSIELSALDLHYLDVNYEAVKLLDELRVISKPHGMDRHFPVTKLEIPLDSPEKTQFKLGDSIKTSLTNINNQTNTSILQKIESLPKAQSVLKEAKENATQIMNMATNGYITITQDQYGTNTMYISNDKDYTKATKLWKWNINGLAYSNDGGETFGLAITMDGAIVADFITAGILNADLIKTGKLQDIDGNVIFDLSTGTLTIKKGSINIGNGAFKVDADGKLTATKGSFSGDVIMGPGSVITWDNLPDGVASTGQIPTSPEDIGALPASDLPSYITKTKITQTTIESPDIRGGTITSDTTIDVGTDLKVGNNVYLGKYAQSEDKYIYLKDNFYLYTIGDSLGITAMGNIIINPAFGVYIGNSDSPDNEVATKGDVGTPIAVFG